MEAESQELSPEVEAALKALAAQSFAPEAPAIEKAAELSTPKPEAPEPKPEQSHNDATEALKRQIEALNQSRIAQEQAAQQAADAALAAHERRQAWLESTPGAKEHRDELGLIHHAAIEGGLHDASDEYFDFMGQQLAAYLQEAEPKPEPKLEPKLEPKPTPSFRPTPARNPASMVSAPVSRSVPNASGKRHQTPGRVTLTPQEVEAAMVSGITPEEYAREKLRYQNMREDGSYRDNRGER